MKIAAVDLSAIYAPIWHIKAEDGPEVYRATLAQVARLVDGYDRVAICVDAGDSGRKDIDPEYKANRPPKPAPYIENLKRVVESLDSDGYHILKAKGFEADDVIATLCRERGDDEVFIIGLDKDLLQLVDHELGVHFINHQTGEDMTPQDKLGVTPRQVPMWLALVGDSADNIKGAPGVGPKGATAMLQMYDWDTIMSGTIGKPATQKSIQENRGSIQTALELTTLRKDVPIDCSVLDKEKTVTPRKEAKPAEFEEEREQGRGPEKETAVAVVERPKAEVVSPGWERELEPRDGRGAYVMASKLFESRLFSQYGNQDAVFAVIVAGREFGLGAMASVRGFHIIEGKPAMSSQLMAGLVLKSGLSEYFEPADGNDDKHATWITKRKGRPEKSRSFSIEDADRAGLTKPTRNGKPSMYMKYPSVMLDMRACSMLARIVYPDIIGNVYSFADFDSENVVIQQVIANEQT